MAKSLPTNAYHMIIAVAEWMRQHPNSPVTEQLHHVRSHDEMVEIFNKEVLHED